MPQTVDFAIESVPPAKTRIRKPKRLTRAQKAAIEAEYRKISPVTYIRRNGVLITRDGKEHSRVETSIVASAPNWIKTQNLVRARSLRVNGGKFQNSTRWCANLERRNEYQDEYDRLRLFFHGAKRR